MKLKKQKAETGFSWKENLNYKNFLEIVQIENKIKNLEKNKINLLIVLKKIKKNEKERINSY